MSREKALLLKSYSIFHEIFTFTRSNFRLNEYQRVLKFSPQMSFLFKIQKPFYLKFHPHIMNFTKNFVPIITDDF